jgi:predicted Zn-ribbon and HTH transcriptional regulator
MNCRDCTQPLTAAEIRNGRRCDKCEQKWLDRVGEWIRGEGPEPEWGDCGERK